MRQRGAEFDLNGAICLGDVTAVRNFVQDPLCIQKSAVPESLLSDAVIMISTKLGERNARYGQVDLHVAAEIVHAHLDIIQALIRARPPKPSSYSALFEAVQLPNTAVAQLLLEHGVETSDASNSGMLLMAAHSSAVSDQMLELLTRFGVPNSPR